MANSDRVLLRKGHKKSRNGCKTCKHRHIRCDENFPQCENCTRHHCKCSFIENLPGEDEVASKEKSEPLVNPGIEFDVELQRNAANFSFSDLQIFPGLENEVFSVEELRFMYFISSIRPRTDNAGNFALRKSQIPIFLRIGIKFKFVMHALLALSSGQTAWLTNSTLAEQTTYEHRGMALKGLREAITVFSRENSDAVLAASLLFSWQEVEWSDKIRFLHGTSAIIHAMQPWQSESQFGDLLARESAFCATEHYLETYNPDF